jgi:hypothetical protein
LRQKGVFLVQQFLQTCAHPYTSVALHNKANWQTGFHGVSSLRTAITAVAAIFGTPAFLRAALQKNHLGVHLDLV